MPTSRLRRHAALLCIAAAAVTATAGTAQAQLGGLVPSLGALVTDTGRPLGSLPGVGGAVIDVTGTAGGAVMGVQTPVAGTVDGALGSVLGGAGGLLPQDTLGVLLTTLIGGGSGGGWAGGPIVLNGGQVGADGVIVDASAPRPAVRVLSRLRSIGRTGKMRLEVRTDEPGIVALAGAVRPGRAVRSTRPVRSTRRSSRSSRGAHSRKVIRVPSIVLGYRRAGWLTVTVKLSRSAQRTLGRSRNARLSAGTLAADLFRNQASERSRLTIRR